MKKMIKWLLIVLVVIFAAILVLPMVFKGKIVEAIKTEVNKKLNATVNFDNNISIGLISTFPNLNITINKLSVANKGEFLGDTLIAADEFYATIDLMSVFKGDKIEIVKIALTAPRIQAKVLKNGSANWAITIPDTTVKASEDTAASKFTMGLKSFEIKNGYIVYDDAEMGLYTKLDGFNQKLSGDFTADNFILQTIADIKEYTFAYGGVNYLYRVKTSVDAGIDMDMKNFKFVFKDNKINLNDLSLGLVGYFAMPGDDMDMDLNLECKQTDFKNILSLVPGIYKNNFSSLKTSGKMALNGYLKGIMNDTRMPAFGANLTISEGAFSYPNMPSDVKHVNVNLAIKNPDGVPDHTLIDLSSLHAEIGPNPVDVKLYVATPVSDPDIDLHVKGKLILDELVKIVPLEKGTQLAGIVDANLNAKGHLSSITKKQYQNFNADGTLAINQFKYQSSSFPQGILISKMNADFTPSLVNLTAFESTIGNSDMRATGKIENFLPYIFDNQVLQGNMNLQSKFFNLNQFMSADTKDTKTPQPKDTVPMTAVALPANIDFVIQAAFDELLYDNLPLKNVKGEMQLVNQTLILKSFTTDLFNGQVGVKGKYSAVNIKQPDVDFKIDLKNMDIGTISQYFKTFKTFAPIADYIKGNFSTSFTTKTSMDEHMNPNLSILTALGNFELPNFKIAGYEPLDKIATAFNQNQYKQLAIDRVKANFKIENGRIHITPFSFKMDQSKATVKGSNGIDLTQDYTIDMLVPRSQLGDIDKEVNSLMKQASDKGVKLSLSELIPVKVLIGGTVKKPTINIDLKETKKLMIDDLKNQLKGTLQAKTKEQLDKAKAEADRVKQEAENRVRAEAEKARQAATSEADRLKKEAAEKAKAEAEKAKKEGKEKLKDGIDNLFKKKK